jgi:hypothetical protein
MVFASCGLFSRPSCVRGMAIRESFLGLRSAGEHRPRSPLPARLGGKASRNIQQALLIFLAGYTAWILVAIWRCADNSSANWATLARGLTIAWAANIILVLTFLQADLLATYMGH